MRKIATKAKRLIAMSAALMAVSTGAAVATASPALADAPYVWDDVQGSVSIYYLPNQDASNYFNVRNGMQVSMICWLDNAGHRWFNIETMDGDYGYVWAAWTYNQVTVPSC
jgi:hypothetical protein